MSNPFKDAAIERERRARERVAEAYTPVVLWVKPGPYLHQPSGHGSVEHVIRRKIQTKADDIPFVDVATENEPHVDSVVTEFGEVDR